MNTLENTRLFLPVLWVFAVNLSSDWATVLGALWLAGRIWYALAYARDPKTRGSGFLLSMLCFRRPRARWRLGSLRGLIA
jgi:glutathione S-transferase